MLYLASTFFMVEKKKIGRMKYYMVCRVPHSWTKVMSQSGEFKVNANHCIQNLKYGTPLYVMYLPHPEELLLDLFLKRIQSAMTIYEVSILK